MSTQSALAYLPAPATPPQPDQMFGQRHQHLGANPTLRRPSRLGGQALESIGHAIEYLIDNQALDLHSASGTDDRDVRDAVHLLCNASRQIFGESPAVVPIGRLGQRISLRVRSVLHLLPGRREVSPVH